MTPLLILILLLVVICLCLATYYAGCVMALREEIKREQDRNAPYRGGRVESLDGHE